MSDIKKHTHIKVLVVIIMILLIFSTFYFTKENTNTIREHRTKEVLENRTEYIGNNSNVVKILNEIDLSPKIKYKSAELQTQAKPYSITINYYEDSNNKEDEEVIYENEFSKVAFVTFSLVKNLDNINIKFKNKKNLEKTFSYSRDDGDKILGESLWDASRSKEKYENFLKKLKYIYPKSINELVDNTVLEKNNESVKEKNKDSFFIIATKVHDFYYEENFLKVFTTTSTEHYKIDGNTAVFVKGEITNSAITYEKDSEKGYILSKYQKSKDGVDLIPSIKKYCTLPVSGKEIEGLAPKITNYLSNSDELIEIQKSKLVKYIRDNKLNINYLKKHEGDNKVPLSKSSRSLN